jgi:hypothetical protein
MRALANVLELQEYKLAKHREVVELAVYSAVCFLVPFLLGHPQLVVGTVVNAALILSALNLPKHKVLPAVLLPSLGVISRGLVFGPFTHLLIITMPFIWLGNYVLILTIKYLYLAKRSNKFLAICIAIMLKVAIIYLAAILLINSGVLPKIFATSMGLTQIYTAVLGALLALSVNKIIRSNAK